MSLHQAWLAQLWPPFVQRSPRTRPSRGRHLALLSAHDLDLGTFTAHVQVGRDLRNLLVDGFQVGFWRPDRARNLVQEVEEGHLLVESIAPGISGPSGQQSQLHQP